MYARSERFDNAVRYGGEVVTTIDVVRAGVTIASDIPWERPSTVTVDETAGSWRTCAVTVVDIDRSLLPRTPQAALAPYGSDLFIRTGFRFPDGTIEQVPMGVFRILTSKPTRDGRVVLTGFDYSFIVAAARFESPKVFARGKPRLFAITELITERIRTDPNAGGSVVSYEGLTLGEIAADTIPLTVFEEGERYGTPWKAVMDLADSGGLQAFFGPGGPSPTCTVRRQPDASSDHVDWSYSDSGTEIGQLTGMNPPSTKIAVLPTLDSSGTYNVYVVTGESSELASDGLVPVRASAEVTNPSSPIYPGTFGRRPTFLASTFIKTTAQAQAVADANLPLKAGASSQIEIEGFPHPAHEAGDILHAQDDVVAVDGLYVLSHFTIDLGLQDPSRYVCRAKVVL